MPSFKGPRWLARNMQRAAGQEENWFGAGRMGAKSLYICIRARVQMQVRAAVALLRGCSHFSLSLAPVESVRQPRAPATGELCCARETPPQVLSDVDVCWVEKEKKKI